MTCSCGNYNYYFRNIPANIKPSQEFLRFISEEAIEKVKDESGRTIRKETKFVNLELLIRLEKECPGIFAKAMCHFDEIKTSRESLNEEGKLVKLSWEEALIKCYIDNAYIGINDETKDIARVFKGKNLPQSTFDAAKKLREEARENGVPEHVLGAEIREETILEAVERIRSATGEELGDIKSIIEELYSKKFTYEWLSKNDPRNSIMGVYCSCCGTITSGRYARNVAIASVVAADVQNIVVRNSSGEIIAKGTMYLDREHGYGVINDFEVNEAYRTDEIGNTGRYYDVGANAEDRNQIFAAFQRGITAFAAEYDRQNPYAPLRQVNVGMGYNRLKSNVEEYERATERLSVPAEYGFGDAESEQYILYDREKILREQARKAQGEEPSSDDGGIEI